MNNLKEIFSNVLGIEKDSINDNLKREECEQWDSFNYLLLISEIESKLKIRFTMEEIESINSYKDLKEIIISKEN